MEPNRWRPELKVRIGTANVAVGLLCLSVCLALPAWGSDPALAQERAKLARELPILLEAGDVEKFAAALARKADVERKMFGPLGIERIEALDQLARLNEIMGDYPAVVKIRQELLEIQTNSYGERDWRTITAKLDLADARARSKLTDRQRSELTSTMRSGFGARKLHAADKAAEAVQVERERLESLASLVGTDTRDYATGLSNLSVYRAATGAYAEAFESAERSVEILARLVGERHPDYAVSLNNLASLNHRRGNYGEALQRFQDVKRVTEDALSKADPRFGVVASNLGALYQELGDFAASLAEYKDAAECLEKAGPDHRPSYVVALGNLGGALHQSGDFPGAMKTYRLALEEYQRCEAPTPSLKGKLLSNLAALHVELDDTDAALTDYQEAEQALDAANPLDHAQLLNNLGLLHHRRAQTTRRPDEFKSAEACHRRALEIRQSQARKGGLRADHPLLGRSHSHLGSLYESAGRFGEAEAEFRQALAFFKDSLGDDHPFVADAMNNLGWVYLKTDRAEDALAAFEEAADMLRGTFSDRHTWFLTSWGNSALALGLLGRPQEAIERQREVLDRSGTVRDGAFEMLSKRQRLQFLGARRSAFDWYLSLAADGRSPAAEFYPAVVEFKGYFTAREEAERLVRERPEAKPLAAKYLQLCAAIKRITLEFAGGGRKDLGTLLREKEAQKEAVEVQLTSFGASFQKSGPDVAKTVAERLPPNAALVDYVQYTHMTSELTKDGFLKTEPRMLAFVLRPGRAPVVQPLGPVETIAAATHRWRDAVGHGIFPESGERLAELVWEPVRGHLDGVQVVIVSPDGPVCGIPFAALPGDRKASVLLEDHAFGYVTSARQWLDRSSSTERPRATGMLVVDRPDFGTAPNNADPKAKARFSVIKSDGWAAVLDALRRHDSGQVLLSLSGTDATAERFRQEFGQGGDRVPHKYLHLETHGAWTPVKAPEGQPDADARGLETALAPDAAVPRPEFRTELAFARANESPDGILTGEEVAALDLRGVDLVVLSACQSGLGDVVPNEGPLSLQRAFQSAGANTLVTSLWQPPVRETRILMAEFYRNLGALGGGRKLEAMRNAQLAARGRIDRPAGPDPLPPYYWAAWVLSGDPGDVSGLRNPAKPSAVTMAKNGLSVRSRWPASTGWVLGGVGALGLVAIIFLAARRQDRVHARSDTPRARPPSDGNSGPSTPR